MTAKAYDASDYAGLSGGRFRFYYGYEETDAEDNWQFVAYENDEEMARYTAAEVGARQFDQPVMVLLKGVAKYLEINHPSPPQRRAERLEDAIREALSDGAHARQILREALSHRGS